MAIPHTLGKGHPSAGDCWEEYAETRICSLGWQKIEGWPSTFLHPKTKSLLIVYVDDFKLVGKSANITPMWAKLRENMDLAPLVKSTKNTETKKKSTNDSCVWVARWGSLTRGAKI